MMQGLHNVLFKTKPGPIYEPETERLVTSRATTREEEEKKWNK